MGASRDERHLLARPGEEPAEVSAGPAAAHHGHAHRSSASRAGDDSNAPARGEGVGRSGARRRLTRPTPAASVDSSEHAEIARQNAKIPEDPAWPRSRWQSRTRSRAARASTSGARRRRSGATCVGCARRCGSCAPRSRRSERWRRAGRSPTRAAGGSRGLGGRGAGRAAVARPHPEAPAAARPQPGGGGAPGGREPGRRRAVGAGPRHARGQEPSGPRRSPTARATPGEAAPGGGPGHGHAPQGPASVAGSQATPKPAPIGPALGGRSA